MMIKMERKHVAIITLIAFFNSKVLLEIFYAFFVLPTRLPAICAEAHLGPAVASCKREARGEPKDGMARRSIAITRYIYASSLERRVEHAHCPFGRPFVCLLFLFRFFTYL